MRLTQTHRKQHAWTVKRRGKSFIHTSMPKSWHESDFARVAVVSVAGGNNCSQYKRRRHVVFAAGRGKEYLKIYETHDLERMFCSVLHCIRHMTVKNMMEMWKLMLNLNFLFLNFTLNETINKMFEVLIDLSHFELSLSIYSSYKAPENW